MRKAFSIVALLAMQLAASAQVTVTFKPNPSLGDNTTIMTTYGCTPTGYPSPAEIINAGTTAEMLYSDWTYNAGGCSHGTIRSLIRFHEINTIPAGATILNAQLRLFGVPTSSNFGNSTYPGSPYPLSNDGNVNRVTSGWNIGTVTWNTQPGTAGTPVAIPPSTSRWNYNASIPVTGMVQSMLGGPVNNNGFRTSLQVEAIYRAVIFAGNGNPDPRLWPELEITYCDPTFTYCFDSNDPYLMQLSVNTVVPGETYEWSVNGAVVGVGATFNYSCPGPGTYRVCLQIYDRGGKRECQSCLNICVAENGRVNPPHEGAQNKGVNNNTGKVLLPTGDMPASKNFTISPNPTHKGWNISIDNGSNSAGKGEVVIYDMNGKMLDRQTKSLNPGNNIIYQDAARLTPGSYLIEFTNGKDSWKEIAIKE